MTQVALARRAGISRMSLYSLEAGSGRPNYRTLLALADALDVAVHTMIPKETKQSARQRVAARHGHS